MAYKLMLVFVLIFVIISQFKSNWVLNPRNSHGRILSAVRRSLKTDAKDSATNAMEESLSADKRSLASIKRMDRSGLNVMQKGALDDCEELLDITSDLVTECVSRMKGYKSQSLKWNETVYMQTWISAALTNQDTCLESLKEANISLKNFPLASSVSNTVQSVSKSLGLLKKIPVSNANSQTTSVLYNRRLSSEPVGERHVHFEDDFHSHYGPVIDGFPSWVSNANRRRLLQTSTDDGGISAGALVVVAQDGSGNYTTITDAINAAPNKSADTYVIYATAGVYQENIEVPKSKTNIMLVGDGIDATVITGNRSVVDGWTTFNSATFAIVGAGFLARDITIENTAGAVKHQAVALRVGSDLSAFYRCSFKGYQDTLYTNSLRQFYRDCDIYGTVDFIFGNAAVVFQNCNLLARMPMSGQSIAFTAQGRTDPNQNTGTSIHNCSIIAAPDLVPVESSFPTYLGRPWKEYSRTIYMQSFIDNLIEPAGWLEWSGDFALSTLYYGEYMNTGPGSNTSQRVQWPGCHPVMSTSDAENFTVSQFISGDAWIPATSVPYDAALD